MITRHVVRGAVSFLKLASILALSFATVAAISGQAPLPSGKASKPAFEVASVKENKSGSKPASNVVLDRSDVYSATGGEFSATNQPLIAYLIFAYKVNVSETFGGLMAHLPQWAISDRFDITARAASHNPSKDEMRLMMQTLLEDRFRLAIHREIRQASVFEMSLIKPGKTGPQLRRHDPGSACSTALPEPPVPPSAAALLGLWPALCGDGEEIWPAGAPRRLRDGGRDMSMSAIASWLTGSGDLDLPLLDNTGLTGSFDFIIEFAPEPPEGVNAPIAAPADSAPAFVDAVQDQLGLKLKKSKGQVSLFFVDHVEYPSAN